MPYERFLDEYLLKSLIKKQQAGFDQINKLMEQANKALSEAKKIYEISQEITYTCAYSAMLYAGRAFMLLNGYRPVGANQHKTVVDFVGECVGDDYKILIQKFDHMRKNRNLLTYEPWKLTISKTDTKNAMRSAEEFLIFITNKIKEKDPQKEFKF